MLEGQYLVWVEGSILSTWVETSWLWELIAELSLSADGPDEGGDAGNGSQHDGRVDLPVLRLCIPSSRWGPDVLWVSMGWVSCRGSIDVAGYCRGSGVVDIRNFCAATL